ncbi:MAG: hypothetical protein ABR552_09955 [Actinomycetota bacterium]
MGKKNREQRRAESKSARKRENALLAAEQRLRALIDKLIDDLARGSELDEAVGAFLSVYDPGPAPAGLAQLVEQRSDRERVRAVGQAMLARDEKSVAALSFAAQVARLDDDLDGASDLLQRVIDLTDHPAPRTDFANVLMLRERIADALEVIEPVCVSYLNGADAQCARAELLRAARQRLDGDPAARCTCGSGLAYGECCAPRERAAIEGFCDPSGLYALRDELLEAWSSPVFERARERAMRDWFGEGVWEHADEPNIRWCFERGWVAVPIAAAPPPEGSFLGMLATDPKTPTTLARRAADWNECAHAGLWQVADPHAQPDVVLVDLVTGVHIHAAIPPEYLEDLPRWSVLLCILQPVDGVWRTGGSMFRLSPREGEMLAAEVYNTAADDVAGSRELRDTAPVFREMADACGGRAIDGDDPLPVEFVSVLRAVTMIQLPALRDHLEAMSAQPIPVANTDGESLVFLNVRIRVRDVGALERALEGHPDIEWRDGEMIWLGREHSPVEAATTRAELRRLGAIEQNDTLRYTRASLAVQGNELAGMVNSEARLERLVALLADAGAEPSILDRTRFDPAQDLPWPPAAREDRPVRMSPAAEDAWRDAWLDEHVPALGGLTPRQAAESEDHIEVLEALLREFEFRAESGGGPDAGPLRRALNME